MQWCREKAYYTTCGKGESHWPKTARGLTLKANHHFQWLAFTSNEPKFLFFVKATMGRNFNAVCRASPLAPQASLGISCMHMGQPARTCLLSGFVFQPQVLVPIRMRHPAGYAIDQLPWVTDLAEAVGKLPHHAVKPQTVTISLCRRGLV